MTFPRSSLWKMLLATVAVFSSAAFAATNLPFKTSERVGFKTVESMSFLGLTKAKGFLGVIDRLQSEDIGVQVLDLYELPQSGRLKVDKKYCLTEAARLVGLEDTTQKVDRQEMFQSRYGPACFLLISDSDPEALIKQRALVVGLVKSDAYAIAARFERKAPDASLDSLRDFFKSLK